MLNVPTQLPNSRNALRKATLICSTAFILQACGSTPIDDTKYARLETKIAEAKEVDASNLAGGELFAAEKKLKKAKSADRNGDREKALRLLKEAELHAELAETRSMSMTQQKSLDEVNAGLATLQRELND